MNELDSWTDEQLVPVFGDRGYTAHSEELIRRRGPGVRRILQYRIHDAEEAGDCEVYVWQRVHQGKLTFIPNGEESARKWINAVAYRCSIDWLRRPSNRPLPGADWSGPSQPTTSQPAAPARLEEAEEESRLYQAIKQLPAEDQAVLILTRPGHKLPLQRVGQGDLTLQEVADLLGYTGPAAVFLLLKRIVRRLRAVLGVDSGH